MSRSIARLERIERKIAPQDEDDEWRATDWAKVAELVTIGDMGGLAVADYGKSRIPEAEAIAPANCSRNSE